MFKSLWLKISNNPPCPESLNSRLWSILLFKLFFSSYVNLNISTDEDFYNSSANDFQGFYKSVQLSLNSPTNTSSYYKGRTDAYGFNLSMNVAGYNTIITNTYNFYIDNLQNLPSINNLLSGIALNVFWRSTEFLKVIIPLAEK